jgi:hypothetical protein
MMKKLIVLVLLALMIGACSSEFYEHDTLYSTNSHWAYSLKMHRIRPNKAGGEIRFPTSRLNNGRSLTVTKTN